MDGLGKTSVSFRNTIDYIEEFEPLFFLLENVWDKATALIILQVPLALKLWVGGIL